MAGGWRKPTIVLVGAILAAVGLVTGAHAQATDTLTLKRVLLSTGGVGYFEYEATVEGDAALTLDVRLDQVDDVLKSVVVFDDRGSIGEISLPGREPMSELFRDLPFGPDALTSPAALLNALRGAEVRIAGARSVIGRIVAVTEEQATLPDGAGTVIRHRLSLMTADGLQQAVLEDVATLQFVDSVLQAQVDAALAALARHNAPDRRRLEVSVAGSGSRTVRVAYVIEAPLWKSSYRLTMGQETGADAADLQGWAIVENLSGEDWTDVALTVVSGNPVTFRQALYEAYYVDRPLVPVEVFGRVLPPVDEGTVGLMADAAGFGTRMERAQEAPVVRGRALAAPAPAQAPASIQAAASEESTTQVVFAIPGPVSVANGHSVLLPMISRRLPAERVSLYQPATDPVRPLASIQLRNNSPTGLPPGVLTLYERAADGAVAFVGDARLAPLPAGESRLVSYAVDEKVRIDREVTEEQTVTAGKIVDGMLDLTVTQRQSTTYTVAGAPREPRLIVIEHPRREGWRLTSPATGRNGDRSVEATESHYRLRQQVAAGTTEVMTVTLERPVHQRLLMSEMSLDEIAYYTASREISPAVRQAIGRLASLQAEHRNRAAELAGLEEQLATVVVDQERLRQNLRATPDGSDLHRRYLLKMTEQEDQIDDLREQIAASRTVVERARQAVLDYVRGLNV